jgi:hypothetical protein
MADNIFDRLTKGRPPPIKKAQEVSPAQRLLDFLQRWPKDVISVRNIQQFGPGSIRDQRRAMNSAEVLVRYGWLAPVQKPARRDRREWKILRRPPVVHPTVAR